MYAVRQEKVRTKTVTNARTGAVNVISGFHSFQTEMEAFVSISTTWMVETRSRDQRLEFWITLRACLDKD